MVSKTFLALFFLSTALVYSTAKLTKDDEETIKSIWAKVQKKPDVYAKDLLVRIIDDIAVPVAKDVLKLVEFIFPDQGQKDIINLIKSIKTLTTIPQFKKGVNALNGIVNKYIIPKLDFFVKLFNNRDEILKKNISMIVDIALQVFQSILKKTRPVADDFMSKDWTAGERKVVGKIIDELETINKQEIKSILRAV